MAYRVYGGPPCRSQRHRIGKSGRRASSPLHTIYASLGAMLVHGKTPPCSKPIIEKKKKNPGVVVGMRSFKEVRGRGIKCREKAGIEVVENVLKRNRLALNR